MVKIVLIGVVAFLLVWANKIRIYLKWQKKKRRNDAPFFRWPSSVHSEPIQAARLQEARTQSFKIEYQDKEKGLARIQGESDPEMIWCHLGMCRCPEFKENHKPCKHIYKIAIEKGLIE